MPLSREERHALAVRIRLGELPEGRHTPITWKVGYPIHHAAARTYTVSVLGVVVLTSRVDPPHFDEVATWEDGTTAITPVSLGRSRFDDIMAYLERD